MIKHPEKILLIAASGIGNTILATPLVRCLREAFPKAQIDLLTSRRIFQAPLYYSDLINNFYDLERTPLGVLLNMRRARYAVSINCFPSNRWQFNFVAYLVHARLRVTHKYDDGNHLGFMMNRHVPADAMLHDIEQNLRLITALNVAVPATSPDLMFALNADAEARVAEWVNANELVSKPLTGIHWGGGVSAKYTKKWFMNKPIGTSKAPAVAHVIAALADQPEDAVFIIFGGEDEDRLIEEYLAAFPPELAQRCIRYKSNLWCTAALIKRCHYFISGDTGLMHIAAVFKIPQKAYFRVTNPSRTSPRNPRAVIVTEPGCAGYQYPFTLK